MHPKHSISNQIFVSNFSSTLESLDFIARYERRVSFAFCLLLSFFFATTVISYSNFVTKRSLSIVFVELNLELFCLENEKMRKSGKWVSLETLSTFVLFWVLFPWLERLFWCRTLFTVEQNKTIIENCIYQQAKSEQKTGSANAASSETLNNENADFIFAREHQKNPIVCS